MSYVYYRKGYGQMYYIICCKYVFYVLCSFGQRIVSKGLGKWQKLGSSLHGINSSEIRGRRFIIIDLSCDSCLEVAFTRHSRFADSHLPRVYLENLSETPPRGQKKVVDMTD